MLKDDFPVNFKCGFTTLTGIEDRTCVTDMIQHKKETT